MLDFVKVFVDEDACEAYLKWKEGFTYKKCRHTSDYKAIKKKNTINIVADTII